MKKSFVPVLVLTLLVLTAAPAIAGLTWCSTDPVVLLPDGSVVHVLVAVPEGHENDLFTLTLTAPAGSRLLGQVPKLNINVVLRAGPDGEMTASHNARFPVMVFARSLGAELDTYVLQSRRDKAVWNW